MRFLFLSILLFGFYNAATAQPIFIPYEGRREVIKTAEFTPEESNTLKTGEPCGQYFSYEEVADQKIVTFKVTVSDAENSKGIYGFNRVGLNLLKIRIDNRLKVPTIEYRPAKFDPQTKRITGQISYIFRMSAQDFREATCLAGLR